VIENLPQEMLGGEVRVALCLKMMVNTGMNEDLK